MNQEKLLQDVTSLPPIAQQEAIDFIAFLKLRYGQHTIQKDTNSLSAIENEPFIGMWQNRSDMADSSAWVRRIRQKEWG